jgi:hypothetical protein
MGKDRYHYNKNGQYRGKSSDKGPYEWIGGLVVIVIIVMIFRSC